MTGIYSHHLAALIQALCRYLHMPTVPLIKPRVFFLAGAYHKPDHKSQRPTTYPCSWIRVPSLWR
jgi:hypothetical protein